MTKVEKDFLKAVTLMKRPPFYKLLKPGIGKFIERLLWRTLKSGTPKVTNLFFGGKMTIVPPEVVSEVIDTYGFFDEYVTWLVVSQVKPGDVVLDLGAHFGYFSLLSAYLVGDEGRVLAFEPTPSTFDILKENSSRAKNIRPLNLAVGNENGERPITDFGLKHCAWNTLSADNRMPDVLNSVKTVIKNVKVVKLDDYIEENGLQPSFIKIDTEYFEYEVILGLEKSITEFHPKIVMEAFSDSSRKAGESLLSMGYKVFVSDGFGSLYEWKEEFKKANDRYHNILFQI